MSNINLHRRILTLGLGVLAAGVGIPSAHSQAKQKIRIGYLRVLSVDGHLWLASHMGAFEAAGLQPEFREFNTGIELFQALIGGSIDVLTCGAVLSNFPARGQGKVFLINSLETKVGQVWVSENSGIKKIEDLRGKKIATTIGTTAHICLHEGLKSAGLDSEKDVEIINQRMGDAVTAFIAGAVPAVATWVPFNTNIKARLKGAKMLFDASAFPAAWVVGGWAARNDYYEKNKPALKKLINAWSIANDMLINQPQQSLSILHEKYYSNLKRSDVAEMYGAFKLSSIVEWSELYSNGAASSWLDQVTKFNVDIGAIDNAIYANKYFDKNLLIEVAKDLSSSK